MNTSGQAEIDAEMAGIETETTGAYVGGMGQALGQERLTLLHIDSVGDVQPMIEDSQWTGFGIGTPAAVEGRGLDQGLEWEGWMRGIGNVDGG